MSLVKWSKELETGHPQIDTGHKSLLQCINDLYDLVATDPSIQKLAENFLILDQYIEQHFRAEEELMRDIRYHDAAEHFESHDLFIEKISGFYRASKTDSNELHKLVSFLMDWLLQHIFIEDKGLVAALEHSAAA